MFISSKLNQMHETMHETLACGIAGSHVAVRKSKVLALLSYQDISYIWPHVWPLLLLTKMHPPLMGHCSLARWPCGSFEAAVVAVALASMPS